MEAIQEAKEELVGGEKTYPIAETFASLQGEGRFMGHSMSFIRLAGCTVGKPYTQAARDELGLQVFQERCTDWQGDSFPCDTNYRMHKRMTVKELLLLPEIENAERVCITGGEPLMHPIKPLIKALQDEFKKVHIETSGTIELRTFFETYSVYDYRIDEALPTWVTVSPKLGCLKSSLERADEIKVLIGPAFDESKFLDVYSEYMGKICISAINDCYSLEPDNLQRCVKLQQKYPELKISIQLHKILNVR